MHLSPHSDHPQCDIQLDLPAEVFSLTFLQQQNHLIFSITRGAALITKPPLTQLKGTNTPDAYVV